MEKSLKTTFSITANIDLLGFSNHLIMSNYDLRTKIGEEAIQRLKTIENAIDLISKEFKQFPDYYPETFRYLRFNDSLILGIDINPPILPNIGKPNEGDSYSFNDVKKFYGEEIPDIDIINKAKDDFDLEAFKVCQFLGITARIHNYINTKEYDTQMPGCRTIIATGLRYKFYDNQNKEDYYSANFSFSNAYLANEAGSKGGFSGNKCYIENNAASICGLNIYSNRLIGFAKYKMNFLNKDPFDGKPYNILKGLYYSEAKVIDMELFNKAYHFRELNTTLASNFQIFPSIIKIINTEVDKENTLLINILKTLTIDTPNINELNSGEENPHFKYPLLYFSFRLEDNIKDSVEKLINDHTTPKTVK